jgi:hypothetical protein
MWFLIRAAFWLSIVFALLPWPEGSRLKLSPPGAMWSRTSDAVGAALSNARAAGEKVCMGSPVACLNAAVRLEQIAPGKRTEDSNPASSAARQPSAPPPGEIRPQPAGEIKTRASAQRKAPPLEVKAALSSPPAR